MPTKNPPSPRGRANLKITITGTPGTGKTTVSKIISRKLNLPLFELSKVIKEKKLYTCYDEKRDSYVVDLDALKKFFEGKESFIAEGVVAHYIPSDVLVILRLHPERVKKRLKKRGYPEEKVAENVESEKLAVIATEAFNSPPSPKILHIDTTDRTPEEVAELILEGIKGKEIFDDVDWLEDEIIGSKGSDIY